MTARDDGYTIAFLATLSADEMRRHGVTSPIGEEATSYERKYGIGAQDADTIELPPWPWIENGEMYALCRRGADAMRRRAFPKNPNGFRHPMFFTHDVMYTSFHTWVSEPSRGIPAW